MAGAGIGLIPDGEGFRIGTIGHHHRQHRQLVFAREIQIALIVRGTAENRAGAVTHQHEIGDHHRQFPTGIERVNGFQPGVVAELLGLFDGLFGGAGAAAFGNKGGKLRILLGQFLRQRMIGRQRHETGPEQRIGPGAENIERTPIRQIEGEAQALGFADPVLLHQPDLFRPTLQRIEARQQFLAETGDAEEPLRQLAPFDRRARAPALAVDHLFIGKHGLIDRVPVHIGFAAIDEARFKEIQEQLLLVAVIFGIAGGKLPLPVDRQPHQLQLGAHGGDVGVGPFARIDLLFPRGVFRRQTESIPPHRVQHVEALCPAEARDHIAHGVIAGVPHMNAPRRIGEHFEHIAFGPGRILRRAEGAPPVPFGLPVFFRFLGVVPRHSKPPHATRHKPDGNRA